MKKRKTRFWTGSRKNYKPAQSTPGGLLRGPQEGVNTISFIDEQPVGYEVSASIPPEDAQPTCVTPLLRVSFRLFPMLAALVKRIF